MSTMEVQPSDVPKCSFGLISDVQYADKADGKNFQKTRTRYYRSSLMLVRRAVAGWASHPQPIRFVLQLGDLIDGANRRSGDSQRALAETLGALEGCQVPVHHVVGNHELYNFRREDLPGTVLNSSRTCAHHHANPPKPDDAMYYHFTPERGFRVVILDTYEVSMLGETHQSAAYQEARRIVRGHNPNKDINSSTGLVGLEKRFLQYNGALSETQVAWLDQVLQAADAAGEKVLVAGHIPVFVNSTTCQCLCWNYEHVLATLHRHRCVVAYVAGHDHDGGHAWDEHGICHVTMPGVIETAPEEDCYGVMQVYEDRAILQGFGRVQNITIDFNSKDI